MKHRPYTNYQKTNKQRNTFKLIIYGQNSLNSKLEKDITRKENSKPIYLTNGKEINLKQNTKKKLTEKDF